MKRQYYRWTEQDVHKVHEQILESWSIPRYGSAGVSSALYTTCLECVNKALHLNCYCIISRICLKYQNWKFWVCQNQYLFCLVGGGSHNSSTSGESYHWIWSWPWLACTAEDRDSPSWSSNSWKRVSSCRPQQSLLFLPSLWHQDMHRPRLKWYKELRSSMQVPKQET